jgi:restriction system protein
MRKTPIPNYQQLMKPLLEALADGKEHALVEISEQIAKDFGLTEDQLSAFRLSGGQRLFENRIGWAKTYLSKARLVEYVRRGYTKITERGLKLLEKNDAIDNAVLKQYPEFLEFLHKSHPVAIMDPEEKKEESNGTPEEQLEESFKAINETLKYDLLEKVKSCSAQFFENLVIDLLLQMGYGGSRSDAGRAIGKSGDGGIDGIIKEDKLGLDIIYVQAKKWEGTVPVNAVRDFAGSLLGKKANKGIMLTTSGFPKSAYEFVEHLEQKIILIDGDKLADLMIEHNAGIYTHRAYEIKKMDFDYFDEE